MAASRRVVSLKKASTPVWVEFAKGRVRGIQLKRGSKMSTIRYVDAVDFPTYTAKKGEERRVANIFITPRR
jgi:hypothetical protein